MGLSLWHMEGKDFEGTKSTLFLSKRQRHIPLAKLCGSLLLGVQLQKPIYLCIWRTSEVLWALVLQNESTAATCRMAPGFPSSMCSSVSVLCTSFLWDSGELPVLDKRLWAGRALSLPARQDPSTPAWEYLWFYLKKASRMPVVQHFVRSGEILIILDVECTLKARHDTVLSPFHFFLPHLFQDTQVLLRQSNL